MSRGATTALLATVLYGGLLAWSVAWRRASLEPADGVVGGAAEPGSGGAEGGSAPALRAASLAAEFAGGRWEVEGRVGGTESAQRLRAGFAATAPGAEVVGEIVGRDDVEVPEWADAVVGWLPQQQRGIREGSGLAVLDGQLIVAGAVYSDAEREALLAAAEDQFAGSGLQVVGELTVVEPPAPAQLEIAEVGEGGMRLAGRLREREVLQRLLEIIDEFSGGMPVDEQVEAGDGVAAAAWGMPLLQVVPGLLAEVGGLHLSVEGDAVTLRGEVAAEETRAALEEMAGQAFEGLAVRVDNQLTVAVPPVPPHVVLSVGERGGLRIAGLLGSAEAARGIEAAVRQQLEICGDGAQLEGAIEVRGRGVEAAPWVGAFTNLVAPFAAAASWGALSVHGDEVALEAEVADPESGDVLTVLVENAFPEPAFKRVIEVSVVQPEGPSDEDLAELERLVGETVIYFDSGRAEPRAGSDAALSALARGLVKVPGAGLALIGCADPSGDPAANRRLSQRRCEAVREALEGHGVDFLLMEIEVRGEVAGGDDGGRRYESARRVQFELR